MVGNRINLTAVMHDAASGPLKAIRKSADGLGHSLVSLGKTLVKSAAVGLAALGAALGAAVLRAAAFEKAMLNVNSIAKATPADFDAMKQSVIDLSRVLPQSAETLAQGLYNIASSGFAGKEGLDVLNAAAKAASAGLATTDEAAAAVTAVLNAYALKATDAAAVSDILFKIVDRGVVSFPELAGAIGTTTALSSKLGVSLEEVGAGIAVLTKNGIDAENSTTQLNAIMTSILVPSAQAAELAEKLGLAWNVDALESKGLSGVLADLIKKTGGAKDKMALLLGDSRAIRGAFVLAGDGGKAFNEELAQMKAAAGATDTALSYQKKGLAFQFEILKNNLDAAAISIGTALIPLITPLVSDLGKWFTENEKLITSIGTGLVTGIRTVITWIGEFVGKAQVWVTENKPLIDQIKHLAGTVLKELWTTISTVVTWVGNFVDSIAANKDAMNVLRTIAIAIAAAFVLVWEAIKAVVGFIANLVGAITSNKTVMTAFKTAWDVIGTAIGKVIDAIRTAIGWVQAAIKGVQDLVAAIGKIPPRPGSASGLPPPKFAYAAGGWVGLRGPEMALVGERGPEYIIPNHQLGRGGGGQMQRPIIHIMKVYLNKKQIAEAVDEENYWRQ